MPTGLRPLGDNRVAARLRRRQRLAERTNLPEGQRPPAWMRSTTAASGSPQNTSTTWARRAANSSSSVLAGTSKAKKPTPTGLSVRAWTQLNWSSRGSGKVEESIPSPPALLTAAASSGVPVPPPMTASWMGARQPTNLVNGVPNSAISFATLLVDSRHALSLKSRGAEQFLPQPIRGG